MLKVFSLHTPIMNERPISSSSTHPTKQAYLASIDEQRQAYSILDSTPTQVSLTDYRPCKTEDVYDGHVVMSIEQSPLACPFSLNFSGYKPIKVIVKEVADKLQSTFLTDRIAVGQKTVIVGYLSPSDSVADELRVQFQSPPCSTNQEMNAHTEIVWRCIFMLMIARSQDTLAYISDTWEHVVGAQTLSEIMKCNIILDSSKHRMQTHTLKPPAAHSRTDSCNLARYVLVKSRLDTVPSTDPHRHVLEHWLCCYERQMDDQSREDIKILFDSAFPRVALAPPEGPSDSLLTAAFGPLSLTSEKMAEQELSDGRPP